MRVFAAMAWGLIPMVWGVYHFGPGQEQTKYDQVDLILYQAKQEAKQENWKEAVDLYNAALMVIPKDKVHESRKIRLERNKARMLSNNLPAAYLDLEQMLSEMTQDKNSDPELLKETRSAMANAQYYVTWTVRLEGATKDEWEPIIEGARQNYRLLAENAKETEDKEDLEEQQENLEAVIKLADIGLKELQAMPIPKQCNCKGCKKGCCNGKGKKKGKGKSKSKAKDNRGATAGPPPDNSGS